MAEIKHPTRKEIRKHRRKEIFGEGLVQILFFILEAVLDAIFS